MPPCSGSFWIDNLLRSVRLNQFPNLSFPGGLRDPPR
jgi:hypothetical protein